ncbi:MAG: methyltransferase domain-containing protein [Patescibacteria group bacterium]
MNKFFDFVKQVYQNKSLYRILFNWEVCKHCQLITDKTIDISSGKKPSYHDYLPLSRIDVQHSNFPKINGDDILLDLNQQFPITDNQYDNVLFFNSIYILENPQLALKECCRVLKPSGQLFLSSPFIFNEAREPHDYHRFTSEKLEEMLHTVRFQEIKIIPFGGRFASATSLISKFFYFKTIKFALFSFAILLDKIIPLKLKNSHPAPLGYFCIAKKKSF